MTQLLRIFENLPEIYCENFLHEYFSLALKTRISLEFQKIKSNEFHSILLLLQTCKTYPIVYFYAYQKMLHYFQMIPKHIYEKKCVFEVYFTSSYYLSSSKSIRNFIHFLKQKQKYYEKKYSHYLS